MCHFLQLLLEEHETAVAACDLVRQFLATYGSSSSDSRSGLDTLAAGAGNSSSSSTAFPWRVKITGRDGTYSRFNSSSSSLSFALDTPTPAEDLIDDWACVASQQQQQ